MRLVPIVAGALLLPAAAQAQEIRRVGPEQAPIMTSVEVPPGSRIVYVSGTVPDPVDAKSSTPGLLFA